MTYKSLYSTVSGPSLKTYLMPCLLVGISISPLAYGAASDSSSTYLLEDAIVVTATKTEKSLQQVAIAISAAKGDQLKEAAIDDLMELQHQLPNVSFGARLGSGTPTIRGVGFEVLTAGASSNVAVHSDGVYISRPTATLASYFDIERIEVLRGPQGTLYGRNAAGGVVNMITNKPTEDFTASFDMDLGNYNARTLNGAIGGALVEDKLLVRLATKIDKRDGYGKNIFNGQEVDDRDNRAVRASIRWLATEALTIDFTAETYKQRDSAYGFKLVGPARADTPLPGPLILGALAVTDLKSRNVAHDAQPISNKDLKSYSSTISWQGENISAKYIAAYRDVDAFWFSDLDGTSALVFNLTREEDAQQISHELQLSGATDAFDWIMGLYYFEEENDARAQAPPKFFGAGVLDGIFDQFGQMETRAVGVFAEGTIPLSENFSLTLGARFSDERIKIDEYFDLPPVFTKATKNQQDTKRFRDVSPKVVLEYQADNDMLLYASVTKGFKSGGYAAGAVDPAFDEESIISYELGMKSTLFDGRMQWNLNGFYYNYKDLQVGKVVITTVVENAADSTIYGIESELKAYLTDNFSLQFNLALLHAEYDDFTTVDPTYTNLGSQDLKGNQLLSAPNYSVFLAAEYIWPLAQSELALKAELVMSDEYYLNSFNNKPLQQSSYTLSNLYLNYRNDNGWFGKAYIKNVGDEVVMTGGHISSSGLGFPVLVELLEPRTYGFTLGYEF